MTDEPQRSRDEPEVARPPERGTSVPGLLPGASPPTPSSGPATDPALRPLAPVLPPPAEPLARSSSVGSAAPRPLGRAPAPVAAGGAAAPTLWDRHRGSRPHTLDPEVLRAEAEEAFDLGAERYAAHVARVAGAPAASEVPTLLPAPAASDPGGGPSVLSCARGPTRPGHSSPGTVHHPGPRAAASPDDAEASLPEQVGRYRVEGLLGEGAQARVLLGWDPVLERRVALKVLSAAAGADPARKKAFLAEARRAARVGHVGCLAVLEFGVVPTEPPFFAMEYFDGRTLASLLQGGALEPFLALHLARELADTLHAVHLAGLVHRDVKPSNILVDRAAHTKLTDFGISAEYGYASGAGPMTGTTRYVAPEQARGEPADRRADLFGLGVVLWEMLAGAACFEAGPEAVADRASSPAPPLPSGVRVGPEVQELLVRCLAPDPADRPSSAAELSGRLGRALRAAQPRGGR